MAEDSPFTVDADWLQKNLGQPGLSIVDASWYLPGQQRDALAEYKAGHVPGAVFLDLDAVSDQDSPLPHTLASPRDFAQFVGSMGISADDTIVVYDGPGFFSAPRAWWMFRVMGVFQTYLLDGGFDGWKAQGRPVTAAPTKIAPCVFHADFDATRLVGLAEMRRIVANREVQIADARPAGRFSGVEPEPRAGMRSGHMPGARNVPASALSENGIVLTKNRLREVLEGAGIDLSKPVITSCGSGVTAAAITFALETLGHTDNRLYDGSWAEWGALADTPVAIGED